jgi:hypothetical protein
VPSVKFACGESANQSSASMVSLSIPAFFPSSRLSAHRFGFCSLSIMNLSCRSLKSTHPPVSHGTSSSSSMSAPIAQALIPIVTLFMPLCVLQKLLQP